MKRRGFLKFLVGTALSAGIPKPTIVWLAEHTPVIGPTIGLSFAEIVAVTFRNHRAEIIANIIRENALLNQLSKNKKKLPFVGGNKIQ